MGGIGYKLPPQLFGLLEAIRQGVELIGKYGEFVLAPNFYPMLIVALLYPAYGLQQALVFPDNYHAKHHVKQQRG